MSEKITEEVKNERYTYTTGFLCDECKPKKINELVEKLLSIGFRKVEY